MILSVSTFIIGKGAAIAVSLVKGCMAGLDRWRRSDDGVMTTERENFQPGAAGAAAATLYDYWSSSSAYRVRIALALKGIAYRRVVIRRLDGIEEPGLLRASIRKASCRLSRTGESGWSSRRAIIEYLEERWPDPPLLPAGAGGARAGPRAGGHGRERHPAAEQSAGAGRAPGRVRAGRGRAAPLVRPLDRRRLRGHRAPPAREPGHRHGSATATRRRSPTSVSCRRCSTPGAGRAISSPTR